MESSSSSGANQVICTNRGETQEGYGEGGLAPQTVKNCHFAGQKWQNSVFLQGLNGPRSSI